MLYRQSLCVNNAVRGRVLKPLAVMPAELVHAPVIGTMPSESKFTATPRAITALTKLKL